MPQLAGTYKVCHPLPCISSDSAHLYQHMLIPIRDPVDRFVSAFDWRKELLCAPKHEPRIASSTTQNDISGRCISGYTAEYTMLMDTYGGDANRLAESLCSKSWSRVKRAQGHIKMIGHAQTTLIEHLGGKALFQVRS